MLDPAEGLCVDLTYFIAWWLKPADIGEEELGDGKQHKGRKA